MFHTIACLLLAWSGGSTDSNLISGGGFEQETLRVAAKDSRRGVAGPWSYVMDGTAYVRAEAGDPFLYGPAGIPETFEGDNALYVGCLDAGHVALSRTVKVQPRTPYEGEVWVRAVNADGQGFGADGRGRVMLVLTELDRGGQAVAGRSHEANVDRANDQYEPLRRRFCTGSETASVRLSLEVYLSCNHWHGAVKLDGVRLRPATAGEPVAVRDGKMVTVLSTREHKDLAAAATWLSGHLRRLGFRAEDSAPAEQAPGGKGPLWVLETLDACPLAKARKLELAQLAAADPRRDGYVLDVGSWNGRPTVHVVGRNSLGVFSGIARALSEVTETGVTWYIYPVHEAASPFVETRRIHFGQTGRIARGTPFADTLWTNWDDARIRDGVEQLRLCGFNSIEVAEIRGYGGRKEGFTDQELATQATPKVRVAIQAAHDQGMSVSQFIWGQSLFAEGQNPVSPQSIGSGSGDRVAGAAASSGRDG